VKTLYAKIIVEEIIRLQAHGFSAEETREYLQEHYQKKPALNTIYNYRKSPIGQEILEELIRQQERSILKTDSTNPTLAMKYRSDLIGKLMDKILPTKQEIRTDLNVNGLSEGINSIIKFSQDESNEG